MLRVEYDIFSGSEFNYNTLSVSMIYTTIITTVTRAHTRDIFFFGKIKIKS